MVAVVSGLAPDAHEAFELLSVNRESNAVGIGQLKTIQSEFKNTVTEETRKAILDFGKKQLQIEASARTTKAQEQHR